MTDITHTLTSLLPATSLPFWPQREVVDWAGDPYQRGSRDTELIVCVCVCAGVCGRQAMSLERGWYRGALRPQEIHRDRQAERVKPVRESGGDRAGGKSEGSIGRECLSAVVSSDIQRARLMLGSSFRIHVQSMVVCNHSWSIWCWKLITSSAVDLLYLPIIKGDSCFSWYCRKYQDSFR